MVTITGRVTLSRIDEKLDSIKEMFNDHKERFNKHCDDDDKFQREMMTALAGKENTPGLATRVDRLEQVRERVARHYWIIYTCLASLLIGFIFNSFGK